MTTGNGNVVMVEQGWSEEEVAETVTGWGGWRKSGKKDARLER